MTHLFIYVVIEDIFLQLNWHFVLVSMACDYNSMYAQFDFLSTYCSSFQDLLIAGDFNTFLRIDEKSGCNHRLGPKLYLF